MCQQGTKQGKLQKQVERKNCPHSARRTTPLAFLPSPRPFLPSPRPFLLFRAPSSHSQVHLPPCFVANPPFASAHPLLPLLSLLFHHCSPTQSELQKQVEREKALAEAEGRIKENRENEDVNRRAALLK